jgi:hypothetical protein
MGTGINEAVENGYFYSVLTQLTQASDEQLITAYLRAKLIDTRRFAIVQPRIVEHQPHVIDKLPRITVLTIV